MTSKLLALPRELRDNVLQNYVASNGGYTYNFTTNKLRHANGDPIDLSLALTCRQLGHEMRGLALRTNTIHFSTFFSEETREQAGLFDCAIQARGLVRSIMVKHLAPKLLTPGMVQTITQRYPDLAQFVEAWILPDDRTWKPLVDYQPRYGVAPSLVAEVSLYVLNVLSAQPNFVIEASTTPIYGNLLTGNKTKEVLRALSEPWDIPTTDEIEEIAAILGSKRKLYDSYCQHIKYTYSAAAVAIRFLKSMTPQTRSHSRQFILHEDFESIGQPECHARGLIAFCKENPRLRIVRLVKLWQTTLSVDGFSRHNYNFCSWRDMHGAPIEEVLNDKLTSRSITQALGSWIVEAHLLPSMGMPRDSYALVFDGDSTAEKSTMVFGIVQRDVAWQRALDISYERGYLPTPSWADRRTRVGYQYESLPTAMNEISQGKGFIRCNFDLGRTHDAETLAYTHRYWTLERWGEAWDSHEPRRFQTDPPLPPWHELKWQRVLPY